jgi:hypothetical protein
LSRSALLKPEAERCDASVSALETSIFCSQQARTGLVRGGSAGESSEMWVLIGGERTENRGGLRLYHGDAEKHRAADGENVGKVELDGFLRAPFLAVYGVPVADPVCLVLSDVGLLLRRHGQHWYHGGTDST